MIEGYSVDTSRASGYGVVDFAPNGGNVVRTLIGFRGSEAEVVKSTDTNSFNTGVYTAHSPAAQC